MIINKKNNLLLAIVICWGCIGSAYAGGVPESLYSNNEYNGDPNESCPNMGTANPIHIGSGNKYHEEEVYRGGGEFPLAFTFHYNSREHVTFGGESAIYGNWRHSYSQNLIFRDDLEERFLGGDLAAYAYIELQRPEGQSYFFSCYYSGASGGSNCDGFTVPSSDTSYPISDINGSLTPILVGSDYRYEYLSPTGVKESYTSTGQLTEVKNLRGGGTHQLTYNLPEETSEFTDGAQGTITVAHVESARELVITVERYHYKGINAPNPSADIGRFYPTKVQTPGLEFIHFGLSRKMHYSFNNQVIMPKVLTDIVWSDGSKKVYGYDLNPPSNAISFTSSTALRGIDSYDSDGSLVLKKSYGY